MIILITASLSSKMYNGGTVARKFRVRIDVVNLFSTPFFRRGRFELPSHVLDVIHTANALHQVSPSLSA